jgi:hypothetical protein
MIRKVNFGGQEYISVAALRKIGLILEPKESIKVGLELPEEPPGGLPDDPLELFKVKGAVGDVIIKAKISQDCLPQSIKAMKSAQENQSRLIVIPENFLDELPPEESEDA